MIRSTDTLLSHWWRAYLSVVWLLALHMDKRDRAKHTLWAENFMGGACKTVPMAFMHLLVSLLIIMIFNAPFWGVARE